MASDSIPPAPPSSGGLRYALIGGGLLIAAAVVFFASRGCDSGETNPTPTAQNAPDAGSRQPNTALADDDLVIPEEEPDSGPPPDAGPPRIRYVTRYVGGGGGNWACRGNISAGAARGVLREYNTQFRNCYERQLKTNPTLEGRVNVRMRVGADGRVTAVNVGGSLRSRQVMTCVRSIARRIRFPGPQGGRCAVVQVPYNFTPRR